MPNGEYGQDILIFRVDMSSSVYIVSERIDVNKTSATKECGLCHYWFFKDIGFKFEEQVCNKCHDLLTIAYPLKDIAILNVIGATFRYILMTISKNKGLKRLNNSVPYDRGVF